MYICIYIGICDEKCVGTTEQKSGKTSFCRMANAQQNRNLGKHFAVSIEQMSHL